MSISEQRKRRGQEIVKKYRSISGADPYAAAADAIADILLFVAQSLEEGIQIVHCAEMEFKASVETEDLMAEG